MLGALVPCGGGDTIPLTGEKLLIGRRSHCDISLRFSNVSSHHCEMEWKDGYWYLRDLGSSNGTKVNGMRIETKVVMPGDEIMISKHAFTIDYTVATDAPPPEEESPLGMGLLEKAGLDVGRSQKEPKSGNRSGSRSPRKQTSSSKDDFLMEWLNEE